MSSQFWVENKFKKRFYESRASSIALINFLEDGEVMLPNRSIGVPVFTNKNFAEIPFNIPF